MTSEIISRDIINLTEELIFIIVSERSELAVQSKFNDGPTKIFQWYSKCKIPYSWVNRWESRRALSALLSGKNSADILYNI